ncbi:MAG: MBL fold metallo-hydrolase [bacterium]|nr:MBL fold metallo-hydrolase [bacterium]
MTKKDDNIFFKQMEIGLMNNYVYFIGDKSTGETAVVDPAWNTDTIKNEAEKAGYKITAVLLTHGHYDHSNAVKELTDNSDIPVYVSKHELPLYKPADDNIKDVEHNDIINIGNIEIKCIHTPGHSTGCVCYLASNILLTGDTLFIDGCGRCDLPGGDAEEMKITMANKIKPLSDDLIVYPGHNYNSKSSDTLGNQKKTNPSLSNVYT